MTLREFFEGIYIPRIKSAKRSWGDDDRRIKRNILPELGDMPLCSISTEHVQAFLDKAATTYAPASVRHFMAILRRAFNIAAQSSVEGIPLFVGQNPAASARLNLPQVFNDRERFFTQKEASALLTFRAGEAGPGLFRVQFSGAFLLKAGAVHPGAVVGIRLKAQTARLRLAQETEHLRAGAQIERKFRIQREHIHDVLDGPLCGRKALHGPDVAILHDLPPYWASCVTRASLSMAMMASTASMPSLVMRSN
ncbi:MAG: hypothetical protein LBD42_01720 [Desulfovibrio sp.]|nr:hypothetical protein [Desulfovibrio sp.]